MLQFIPMHIFYNNLTRQAYKSYTNAVTRVSKNKDGPKKIMGSFGASAG